MDNQLLILIGVLDDDEATCSLIDIGFKKYGIENYKVFSRESDLMDFIGEDVRICILDHFMGKHTGYEIMMKVKEVNPFCRFIIMSGLSDIYEWRKYLRQRVWDIVPKRLDGMEFVNDLAESVKSLEKDIYSDLDYFAGILQK